MAREPAIAIVTQSRLRQSHVVFESGGFDYSKLANRDLIKECVIGENISIVESLERYANCDKLTFGEDVVEIKDRCLYSYDRSVFIYFYFDGDLPKLYSESLSLRNIKTSPTIYYYDGDKGFAEYEYKKLQGCFLVKIGEETPELPDMTMREFAEKTAAKSIEIATELFERVEKETAFLQFIPYCNITKYKEIKDFTLALVDGIESDREKAKVIFDWIIDNIEYDDDALTWGVDRVFAERKAVCAGYAALYHDMLAAVEIPSTYVHGVSYFGTDCTVEEIVNGNEGKYDTHGWIICYVDGEAIICDPTFGNFDLSAQDMVNNSLASTKIVGIDIVPDEIDPRLYSDVYYYDNGKMYNMTEGSVGMGGGGTYNFIVSYTFHSPTSQRVCVDSAYDIKDAYYNSISFIEENDYEFIRVHRADFQTYSYQDVLRFIAFEKLYYNSNINFVLLDRFYFDEYGNVFTELEDGTLGLVTCASNSERIVVPSNFRGKNVTRILEGSFSFMYSMKEVILPQTLIDIEAGAFSHCSNLTRITIPDRVVELSNGVFTSCYSLKSIYIGKGLEKLSNSIWGTIEYIEVDEENKYFKSIDGSLYSKDGKILRQYCGGKTDTCFTIPEGVTSIGDFALQHSYNLTRIVIPDSVTSIGDHVFSHCINLTNVVIPDSVTSIGSNAFYGCNNLTSINYRGTEEQWNAITKDSNWDRNAGNYTITYNYTGE